MLTVQCPHCSGGLALEPHLAGQPVSCPFCGRPFQMPIPPAHPAGDPRIPMASPVQPAQYVPTAMPVLEVPTAMPVQPGPGPTAYEVHQAALGKRQSLDTGDDSKRSFAGAAYAKSRVAGPALSLMLFAGGALLHCVVALLYLLILRQKGDVPGWLTEINAMWSVAISVDMLITVIGLQVLYYLVVMYGAWKMSDLESHGLAILGAILAMLPSSVCFLLGAPIGIWALAVLGDPDVRVAMKTRGIRRY